MAEVKMRPQTAFETPKFDLIADKQVRQYANVLNVIEFARVGRPRRVPVIIPTQLFTIMKDVFKIERDDVVELYLVKDGEYFVFGMIWGEESAADLWSYSESSLPRIF
jgi:hypothetical protein